MTFPTVTGSDTLKQAADNGRMPMPDKNLSVSGELLTQLEALGAAALDVVK